MTNAATTRHPFESFGPAPYIVIRCTEKLHCVPGFPAIVCGCCDVCMQTIRWAYTIRADNGVEFVTGCDCAMKAGMTAAEIKASRRAYRYAAQEAEEREANKQLTGFAVTNSELAIETAHGAAAARKWLKSERKYEARHVGTIGARTKALELLVERTYSFDTMYGTKTIWFLKDRANNQLIWKSMSGPALQTKTECVGVWDGRKNEQRARWFRADATVKEHGEHEGMRQTEIQRLKTTAVLSDWIALD
jgi:hypothetical protein